MGIDADNPTDPLDMTQLHLDSAVWITYKGRNTWGMTFGEKNKPKGKGGRNLMFAGRAEGDCPPGDVPPPPGACPPGGIEGMIRGGGRVCCPDACGAHGSLVHPMRAVVLSARKGPTANGAVRFPISGTRIAVWASPFQAPRTKTQSQPPTAS